jgi:hypothetical protein
MNYRSNFAKAGDSDDEKLSNWPVSTPSEDPHMQLDVPTEADRQLRKQDCDFCDAVEGS